jgi:hypothetical protein
LDILQGHVATLHATVAQNMNETEKFVNECVGRAVESSPIVECLNVKMAEVQTSIESWEVRMTDLEETEREISKINEQLRKECDSLSEQLQLVQSSAGGTARIMGTESISFNIYQSSLTDCHVYCNNPSMTSDREWQSKAVPPVKPTEETVTVGRCVGKDLNVTSQGGVNMCNNVVGGITNQFIELAMPTFEDLPHQNAQAHINALNEYLALKNIPQALHLTFAMRSIWGSSVTMWGHAITGSLMSFKEFRNAF